ncbi:hypothetical protein [Vibrio cholerae]|uniref:hypothetical protein n=1 Tax=Vibrio cholerae TaxID=666 RepID=UPI0016521A0E|nr:hypothetical protein [Vibrio cholerae]GIC28108.1 phage protein [Vibrio cholerae]
MKKLLSLIALIFTSSASAAYYEVTFQLHDVSPSYCSLTVGTVISNLHDQYMCAGNVAENRTVTRSFISNSNFYVEYRTSTGKLGTLPIYALKPVAQCPSGTSFNPQTGFCEKDEPEQPKYCGSSQMFEDVANLYNACFEQNGIFSYTCDENTQEFNSKCDLTTADQCVIGRPTWPDCLDKPHQPNDPTNPLSPVGGFNPSPVNPSTPSPDVEKPNVEEPDKTETSDTGVINAIKNLNDDLNKSNTDIHNDMNKNFTTMNDALRQLNSTNTAIGQSIVEQMKQDAQIYENNKKLQQQIAANNINAINSQTKSLLEGNKAITGSITGNTDRLVAAVNASGDGVVSAIDGLADKLKPCDPNVDPFNCEGENGLTPSSVESILKQTSAVVTTSQVDAEEGFLTTLKETIDNNLIEDTQSYLEDMKSDLIGALPNSSQCDVDVLKTPYGDFSIGCEYSARLKSILAFVFYIYTLYTLAEILFTGVTPVAGTVPYFSRR